MTPPISTLEFALLGLLRQKPKSGYDLRKTFTDTAMSNYSDSPGSIYPALRRLQTKGLIEPEPGPEPRDRRGREVFRITPGGVAALVEWLGRDLTRKDVTTRLKEIMLRFAFMDGNVPRATAIRFLEQFEREFRVHVAELRARYERDSSSGIVHTGLLAFQFGVESMEGQLEWARRARVRLAANS
jgi:DNA-binding PadR family transcriptional regulator